MADDVVLLPGGGGDTIAADDIGGIKYPRSKLSIGADGALEGGGDVHKGNPLPTKPGISSAIMNTASSVAVAAGSSIDLDSAQISSGLTGKLFCVIFGSSIPLKAELKTVLNGVESAVRGTRFTWPGKDEEWEFPSKDFVTQAHSATAGFDGFRLTLTNLDTSQAADIYATWLYDEE